MKNIQIIFAVFIFNLFVPLSSWSVYSASFNEEFSRWKVIQNEDHFISYNIKNDTSITITKLNNKLEEEILFSEEEIKKLISNYIPKIYNKSEYEKYLRVNDLILWNGDLYGAFNFGFFNFNKNKIIQIPNDGYSIPLDTIKQRYFNSFKLDKNNNLIVETEAIKILRKFIDNEGLLTTHIDSSKTQIYELNPNILFSELFDSKINKFKSSLIMRGIEVDDENNIWIGFDQKEVSSSGLIKINKNKQIEVFDLKSKVNKAYRKRISNMELIDNYIYFGYYPSEESGNIESISKYNIITDKWEHLKDYLDYIPNPFNQPISSVSFVPIKITKFNEKIYYLGTTGILVYSNNTYEYLNFADSVRNKPGFEQSFYHFNQFHNIFFIDDNVYLMNIAASIIIKENLLSFEDDRESLSTELPFVLSGEHLILKESNFNLVLIYDLLGHLLIESNNQQQIPINILTNGVYFVVINNKSYKFIK